MDRKIKPTKYVCLCIKQC
jgi:hypothetical protein